MDIIIKKCLKIYEIQYEEYCISFNALKTTFKKIQKEIKQPAISKLNMSYSFLSKKYNKKIEQKGAKFKIQHHALILSYFSLPPD